MNDSRAYFREHKWSGYSGDKETLGEKAKELASSPGVYVFRGDDGTVLYVGKANSLRDRLRSYFATTLSPKTRALMDKAVVLQTITVGSEKEALILENNLIKKHRPFYNIRLRDDKQYPYVRVGVSEQWPRVTVTRRVAKDGARYFGPYTRAGSVRETLFLLRRLFPYRNCTDRALAQASRPCLDYHIGRCLGPCTGSLAVSDYDAVIDQVIEFLEGRLKDLRQHLEEQMREHAEALEFEAAARIRDQIAALHDVTERQRINAPDDKDRDVLGIARSSQTAVVSILPVRQGKVFGKEAFVLKGAEETTDVEILEAFISQHYLTAPFFPAEILTPCELPSKQVLEEALSEQRKAFRGRGGAVRLRFPKRGRTRDLLAMAKDNAEGVLAEHVPKEKREAEAHREAAENLALAIGIAGPPSRIEGYDVSNLSGKEAVASMVVLKDGRPEKSSYRRFRMKTRDVPDDYAMMQEVLWRRFKKGLDEREKAAETPQGQARASKFAVFPDLVLVDGGKGQVSAAKQVLDELGIDIPLAGLAEKNEELFLPGRSDPALLAKDSGALYLVMRLRDEAHRFALGYHHKLRKEKAFRSVLLDIPGVGPAKAKALLSAYPNVGAVRKAPVAEVSRVRGIGDRLARKIKDHLSNNRGDRSQT